MSPELSSVERKANVFLRMTPKAKDKGDRLAFIDSPEKDKLAVAIGVWRKPEPPTGLECLVTAFSANEDIIKNMLNKTKSPDYRSRLEIKILGWLYDFIRANVKRGRIFELPEVLRTGQADCLGYTKLFTALGRRLGLDAGVVEVLIDNQCRYVSHTIVLVRLSNKGLRFVDFWYGSRNIRHRRLALRIKEKGKWQSKDIDWPELNRFAEISYLPDSSIDAITLYIQGNRHLNKREFDGAIKHYSRALELYPGNARFYYNRGVAYDNLGDSERAQADYARALANEASIIRTLAREHEEVTSLIDLDARGMDEKKQEIYLHRCGFTTRRKSLHKIGRS
jgi:tetratricopeptide (TPR) repeat protein